MGISKFSCFIESLEDVITCIFCFKPCTQFGDIMSSYLMMLRWCLLVTFNYLVLMLALHQAIGFYEFISCRAQVYIDMPNNSRK